MKDHKAVLDKTRVFARKKLSAEESSHDWWHVARVKNTALAIAEHEGGDRFVVELGALLHDIADWKFHDGDITVGPRMAREWLESLGVADEVIERVVYIVAHISFRGGTNKHRMQSLEGKIVQDADRLDAMGAIGIARVFAFGGAAQREVYNPEIAPKSYDSFESFKNSIKDNTSINHFYEKLLLLKDRMNTKAGKALAKERHDYMEQYLKQFYAEWEGRR